MVVVVMEELVVWGGDRWQQRRSGREGRSMMMMMMSRIVVLSLPVTSLLITIITLYVESWNKKHWELAIFFSLTHSYLLKMNITHATVYSNWKNCTYQWPSILQTWSKYQHLASTLDKCLSECSLQEPLAQKAPIEKTVFSFSSFLHK